MSLLLESFATSCADMRTFAEMDHLHVTARRRNAERKMKAITRVRHTRLMGVENHMPFE
jgi:hypothetical protein